MKINKGHILIAVKIVVLVTICIGLYHRIDVKVLIKNFLNIEPGWFTLSFLAISIVYFLAALRWFFIIRVLGERLPPASALKIFLIGMFFSQFLPASVGGDAVRIWLARSKNLSLRAAFNSTFFDRVAGLMTVVLFILASFPFYLRWIDDTRAITGLALTVATALFGMAVLLTLDRTPLINRIAFLKKTFGKIAPDARRVFLSNPGIATALGLSSIVLAMTCIGFYAMGRALGITLPLSDYLVMIPPVILISTLPISFGGWGVREGAMVVAFGFLGLHGETSLLLSVWVGILFIVAALPGGVVWLFFKERYKKTREVVACNTLPIESTP